MTANELLVILDKVVNDYGFFNQVREELEKEGFSEDDYDEVIEKANN